MIGTIVGGAALYNYAKDFKSVNDLKAGDCITAKGLTDESADSVTEIKSVGCSARHDGEVLATVDLTADEADSYGDTCPSTCARRRSPTRASRAAHRPDLTVTALTVGRPGAGRQLVCVVSNADGSKLTGKLGS